MSSNTVRVGIVGAGKRFFEYYVDVLQDAVRSGAVSVTGLHNRTASRGEQAANLLGCRFFSSRDELMASPDVDAIICLLPGRIKDQVALEAVTAGKHIFLETPAAQHPRPLRMLMVAAERNRRVVEVAEDFAFSPEAQLQRMIIESGLLGSPIAVCNDEAGFAYHALARLQVFMDALSLPRAYRVTHFPLSPTVSMDWLCIQYSSLSFFQRFLTPKNHPSRRISNWKVICEKGVLTDQEILCIEDDGTSKRTSVSVTGPSIAGGPDGIVTALSVQLKGKIFSWQSSPWRYGWSRKKQGIAHVFDHFLDQIVNGTMPLYGLNRAHRDIMTWRSGRLAARTWITRLVPANVLHWLVSMR